MTTKGRNKEKARLERLGLLEPNPARRETGIGRQRHQVDGGWGARKTIFDSELYAVLVAIIDDAIAHSASAGSTRVEFNFEVVATVAGLTERQAKALELHIDGRTTTHIADVMEISRAGVRHHLKAGLAKLKGKDGSTPSVVSSEEGTHLGRT